ncbi:hypothetical protein [Arthrobacter sp. A2-55]|uniref:hypothetical protein n=1 Tax=Arthrobacter sp. A2-55 TaxID=2897337 RepID=UPI0021CDA6F6|nr:hypothetical protein [Arthrobacter sp. A2-55]MCU6480490.1 hypothetical protein [Arthrobacter sp. A2-55]
MEPTTDARPEADITLLVTARFKEAPDTHTKRWVMVKVDDIIHKTLSETFANTFDLLEVSISLDGGNYELRRREPVT